MSKGKAVTHQWVIVFTHDLDVDKYGTGVGPFPTKSAAMVYGRQHFGPIDEADVDFAIVKVATPEGTRVIDVTSSF